MNVKGATKQAAQILRDPFETLGSQVAKPILDETLNELGGFFGTPRNLSSRPKSIGQEELMRARNEQKLQEMEKEDTKATQEGIDKVISEYKLYEAKIEREDNLQRKEVVELQEEIAKLAKASGVETKAHLGNIPKKVGVLHIKVLSTVVRFLRIKAEESKSAKELVSQRENAKPATGMLAWVSGKQMKVHEQGTMQLQG